ncbi:MAG: NAD-dependent epimerase/dehydratase family protein [Solirubrobacterales bacterium]|nr:NAD-dependent epimerase/dehydratase family protein [Solirubrobacterales bacterium]MBV9716653.1 NAD-dependent epimerase/dehydratase family protein [Solirubrobacterales bacterium]
MRVVVVGATGNVGTSLLEALAGEAAVQEIVAVARRPLPRAYPRTTFTQADITSSELAPIFRGADAVVHLAWLIQPGRDESVTYAVNVIGSERVFAAAAEARVPALVYASSVGAYSPGPKDRLVDESWPTDGIRSSFYSRHKAAVERRLDQLERERPELRIVRLRPGLIFKREAATEVRRLFAGPLLPGPLLRPQLIPIVPDLPRLRFQAVHSLDVGDAYRRAVVSDARGPFNIAADPILDPDELASIFSARKLRLPVPAVRAAAAATYAMRLQPTEPGWLDMGLGVPLMDSARARRELGWEPTRSSREALVELVAGMREGADLDTPPLARGTTGPARVKELITGVGARQ